MLSVILLAKNVNLSKPIPRVKYIFLANIVIAPLHLIITLCMQIQCFVGENI